MLLDPDDPVAVAAVTAIHTGDTAGLRRLLAATPGLATARIGRDGRDDSGGRGGTRTLLHVVADWPGHFPDGAATVRILVEAGADPGARFDCGHTETPLHWAASSDDVDVLDALLDAGADIDAPGAVIGGGTPLADARAFAQWSAAHRLIARGATVDLNDAATLGLQDHVERFFAADPPPAADEVTMAFWQACHGGRLATARYLHDRGADPNWLPPWEPMTPLDAAHRRNASDLVAWLLTIGAKSAPELPDC